MTRDANPFTGKQGLDRSRERGCTMTYGSLLERWWDGQLPSYQEAPLFLSGYASVFLPVWTLPQPAAILSAIPQCSCFCSLGGSSSSKCRPTQSPSTWAEIDKGDQRLDDLQRDVE